MTGPSSEHELVVAGGTIARFVMLLMLLVVTSSIMVLEVVGDVADAGSFECSLAAGASYEDPPIVEVSKTAKQEIPYRACVSEHLARVPWWVLPAWLMTLAVVAVSLFWVLPKWKASRGLILPLTAVDTDGAVELAIKKLANFTSVVRLPKIVVDLQSTKTRDAVTFGRNGHATVLLHGGLVASRKADPGHFEAVILHEFAHIANRDVTLTYLTIALWRIHVGFAIPSYLAYCLGELLASENVMGWWEINAMSLSRELLVIGLLSVLVYLARAEILRYRELHADRTAVHWGANPAGWLSSEEEASPKRIDQALRVFVEVWRTHPRLQIRRRVLVSPAELFGLRGLPLVLTGIATMIFHRQIMAAFDDYPSAMSWSPHVASMTAAAPIVIVAGVAVWRAVAYAERTNQSAPSSARAGLLLGVGMVVGGLISGSRLSGFVPSRPWVFVFVVIAAVGFMWWLSSCARLWVAVCRGKFLQTVAVLTIVTAGLVFSLFLFGWERAVAPFAYGWTFDIAGARDFELTWMYGVEFDRVPASWLDKVYYVYKAAVGFMAISPFAVTVVMALWIVPLTAWLVPPWNRRALPSMRTILVPALIGGAAGWGTLISVFAYTHTRVTEGWDVNLLVHFWVGMFLALLVAAFVASVTSRVTVGSHRAISSLAATGIASLIANSGIFILNSTDGCVTPLATAESPVCGWQPEAGLSSYNETFPYALPLVVIIAGAVGAMPARIVLRLNQSSSPSLARIAVSSLAVLLIAQSLSHMNYSWPNHSAYYDAAHLQQRSQQWFRVPETQISAKSKAAQARAWLTNGGNDLLEMFEHTRRGLFKAVNLTLNEGGGMANLDHVRPICSDIGKFAQRANGYFLVPDIELQKVWSSIIETSSAASRYCEAGLDRNDAKMFNESTGLLVKAQHDFYSLKRSLVRRIPEHYR